MQESKRVISIKSAMQRRLADLNFESIFGEGESDTSQERLKLEVSIRRLDGIHEVRYWLLSLGDRNLSDFRRSLKIWLGAHRQYSFAVRVLTELHSSKVYLEAPLQLETSLDSWLTNYWGMDEPKLKSHLEFSRVALMSRSAVVIES